MFALARLSLLILVSPAFSQSLSQVTLHYWDFNNPPPDTTVSPVAADIGTGLLTHTFSPVPSLFAGTTLNAEILDSTAGKAFSPAGTDNNGRSFSLLVPTSGYKGIRFTYATRGTSTGYNTHEIEVSVDGTSFVHVSTISGRNVSSWSLQTIDLTSTPEADDNSSLVLRVTLTGATTASGNNRFDNMKITAEQPLPIQLTWLTAGFVSPHSVQIDWETMSETNNYGFFVQRASLQDSSFLSVSGLIPGNGTTIAPHSYTFTDTTATSGRWLYRLKQVDLDNATHFTGWVEASPLAGVAGVTRPDASGIRNYPNPFNLSTVFRFQLSAAGHVKLTVYDLLGREIGVPVDDRRQAGSYEVRFDGSDLPSGIYFYRFETGGRSEVKRMLILK